MKYPRAIRAEILANAIIPEEKRSQEQYHVYFMGGFKRNYQNDIDCFNIEKVSKKETRLRIYLNRNGFYDKLPEALFHRIDHVTNKRTGIKKRGEDEYADVQLQQKNYARKLFQPMENEFFRLSLLVDSFFSKHLLDANRLTVEYLFGKESNWPVEKRQHASLFAYNALFYSIRGNIRKIGIFLSAALQTKVGIVEEQSDSQYKNNNPGFQNTFGNMILGKNAVCGSLYADHAMRWVYRVQADQNLLHKLIEVPGYKKIFDFVQSSLIPAGIEGVFEIIGSRPLSIQLVPADSKESYQYLGYNTAI